MVMRALITGGNGFVGSGLIRSLLDNTNWDIVSVERLPAGRGVRDPRVTPLYHDLLAPLDCSRIGAVDVMVHLAAEVSRARALADPTKSVSAAVLCTHNALEAARKLRVGKFVLVSSGEVLGTVPEDEKAAEDWPLRPEDPYAAGKASAELLVRSYSLCFDVPSMVVRGMNMFGPSMPLDRFLPRMAMALSKGEEISFTESHRNWLSLDTFITALLDLLRVPSKKPAGIYHIVGPERSGRQLVSLASIALGKSPRLKATGSEPERFVLAPSSGLDFEAGFEEAFIDSVRWYA